MSAPTGWAYEPADRSVGIMSDALWHEDCPLADGDNEIEVTETVDGLTTTYTCTCGESFSVDIDPPDRHWEP